MNHSTLKILALSLLFIPYSYGMKKNKTTKKIKNTSVFVYPGSKDILYLAANGNLKGVKFFIEEVNPANIEAQTTAKDTLLHLAAKHNQIEVVKYLLAKKINLNKKNKNGETSLHLAVKAGNKIIVKLLVKAGANVIIKNFKKETALHLATQINHTDIMTILLHCIKDKKICKMYIEQKNSKGFNALHIAADYGKEEALKLLVSYGATIEAKTSKPKKKKILRQTKDKKKKIKKEDDSCDDCCSCCDNDCSSYCDKYGDTPLILASIRGHKNILKLLLKKGANINAKNKNGDTALYLTDYEHIAKILLDNKAKIKIKNNKGQTPLHMTINPKIVKLLLQKGAKINTKDKDGYTPFHEAIAQRDTKKLKILIENGANIEEKIKNTCNYDCSCDGTETPLTLFSISCDIYPSIVKLLIQKGASFIFEKIDSGNGLEHIIDNTNVINNNNIGLIKIFESYSRYKKQFKNAIEKYKKEKNLSTLRYIKKLMLSDKVPTHIKKIALPLLLKQSNKNELAKFFTKVCFDSTFFTHKLYKPTVEYAIMHNLKDVNNRSIKKAAIVLGKQAIIEPIIQKAKKEMFAKNLKKTIFSSKNLVTIKFTSKDKKR